MLQVLQKLERGKVVLSQPQVPRTWEQGQPGQHSKMLSQNKGTGPSSIIGTWLSRAHCGFPCVVKAPHAFCWFRSDSILHSQVLDPGGAVSPRGFAKCACLGGHARDGPPSQQEGRGEPTDVASIEGSRELHFPVPLGQAAMALSCLTISYLLLWGPGLRFSRDGTFLHVSSATRRFIPSNAGRIYVGAVGGVQAVLTAFYLTSLWHRPLTPGSRSCPTEVTFLGTMVQVVLVPTSRATSLGLRDTRDI